MSLVRRVRIWIRPLLFGPLIFFSSSVLSQQPDSDQTIAIPAFLDLATALEIAESSGYPGLDIAESKILASTAELAEVKSTYGLRSGIELDPRYVYSVDPGDETTINDSYYRIGINKLISDFGYTDRLSTAAEAEILARANEFVDSRYRHRLKIIGAYMDVQEAKLREQLQGTGVQVVREGDNIRLIMKDGVIYKNTLN